MNFIKSNLSKSEQRKLKRRKIIPASLRSTALEKATYTRQKLFQLGLHIQSGTQDHLWRSGEEMAKLYDLKRLN